MQESLQKRSDQLQMLGSIFSLLDQLDIEDMAVTTDGSQLGKVVSLLGEVKSTFARFPKTLEYLNKPDQIRVSESVRKSSQARATKAMLSHKKSLSQPAIVSTNVSKATASKAAVSSRDISVTSNKNQGKVENSQIPVSVRDAIVFDYLSYVFSDLEMFPSRGSINEFFKAYFTVDFNLNKKSREQVIGRLCRLLLQKRLNRSEIGDILLRETNSKYGAFLKEKDAVFIKGWQQ